MKLLAFGKLGTNRGTPRLFLESARLARVGYTPGMSVSVTPGARSVTIRRQTDGFSGTHTVSQRRAAGGLRPVLDVENAFRLAPLAGYDEIKISASFDQITITPSVRAFHIARARAAKPPFRVLELFCGGGTLTAALENNPLFRVVGGVELEPAYADVWQAAHHEATLIQADLRMVSPLELPAFDVLALGIPCTDHSGLGRAKKGLAGDKAEGEGACGDLYIHALALVQARMPLAVLIENVANYGNAPAGLALKNNLRRLGYDVSESIVSPNAEWNEVSDRKRWVLTATLNPGFRVQVPGIAFGGRVGDFLDVANEEQDRADCARIAGTINALRLHNARHQAMGNGFAFSTIDGSESRCPTIVASYHKINCGPFVQCASGLRLLRQSEIERIQGNRVATDNYATAVQILGQGVLTRVFAEIFRQLGAFLIGEGVRIAPAVVPVPAIPAEELQLALF